MARSATELAAPPLLDVDGLAARLGVTVRYLRRLVEERRVLYVKVGRLVRFDPAEGWILVTVSIRSIRAPSWVVELARR
jgi:excisionase family DNA binding protein